MMKRHSLLHVVSLSAVGLLLVGCSTLSSLNPINWFGSDSGAKPAELVDIKASLQARQLWAVSVGKSGNQFFQPAFVNGQVYAASVEGGIVKVDAASGKIVWRTELKQKLSAGVGADSNSVAVGTLTGEVLVFDATDGKLRWQTQASSEILATPVVAGALVLVRSVDGRVTAYEAQNGKRKWQYQRQLPALTLRNPSGMTLADNVLYVGYPGGKLVALALDSGTPRWESVISLPKGTTDLERVADVLGTPQLQGREVCAASYQGRVTCLDAATGNSVWSRELANGNGVASDFRYVFAVDEVATLYAFSREGGRSVWKQDKLANRRLSQPLSSGRAVVVGDLQGYVHWLSREEGAFLARVATDGSAIYAAPIALDNGVLIQTSGGQLIALVSE